MTRSPVVPHAPSAPESLSRRIDDVLQQALQTQRVVGAVVLVAHHGIPISTHAVGWADREQGKPMRTDTIFRLASVSKPIVSVAALTLAARGLLELDAPVSRWLPAFQPALPDGTRPAISARHLLTHTAGLGYRFLEADAHGPYALAGVSDGMDDADITLEENLRRIASVALQYAPGTAWGYSLATDVLGALIAQCYGASLDVAVRELVTAPLGMRDTGFVATDAERVAAAYVNDAPQPHRLQEGEVVSPFADAIGIAYSPARIFHAQAFPSGGAGMAGTAGDFLHLLETLRQGGGSLLPAAWAQAFGQNQTPGLVLPDAPGVGFGLGSSVLHDPLLARTPESPGTWRWGGAYGHAWFVDPVQNLSVVAFTNTMYEGMSGQFVTDLRDAVYGQTAA